MARGSSTSTRIAAAIWIAAAASLLLGADLASTNVPAPIYLGVLEPPVDQAKGQFHVRVAFRYHDQQWSAMPDQDKDHDPLKLAAKFPLQVSWTIALNGKKLGEVSTVRPQGYGNSDVGLEDLKAGSKPPAIQDGAAALATSSGTAAYRPLVAVSKPNYQDPDQWASFDPPAAMRKQAATAFKQKIALDLNCDGKPTRAYPDSAIQTYGKAYRSMSGDVLIAMKLDPRFNRCGETSKNDEWKSVWFHLKGDKFSWIGNGFTLLDIGDYIGDGFTEVLFQYDGDNRDGYVLLDPRDDTKNEFSWPSH
jgi:hypothetical protein